MVEVVGALTRDDILAVDDIKIERVDVWGRYVFVKALSGKARGALEAAQTKQRGKDVTVNMINLREMIAAGVVVRPYVAWCT